jgi:hypothetical protein
LAQPALSIVHQLVTLALFDALQDTGHHQPQGEIVMPKGEQKGNREKKKPKKEKIKTIAAAPSQKGVGGLQSGYGNKK